jgi:hypothetical protein
MMNYLNGQHDYGGTEQQYGNPCDWQLHRLDRFRGQFVFHMVGVHADHYLNLLQHLKCSRPDQ